MDFTKPEHLSYSTITSFISNRFDWFQRKILGKPFQGNIHTERGNALEHGLDLVIDGKSLSDAKDAACEKYELACKGMEGWEPSVLTSLCDVLDKVVTSFPYQDVEEKQKKVYIDIGLSLPILGFLDYRMNAKFDREIRDLKSTGRKPSSLSQSYKIQGGLYQLWGENCRMIYCYGVHTKTAQYVELPLELLEGQRMVKYAKIAGERIVHIYDLMTKPLYMFSESDRKELFQALMFPDLDAMWNKSDYKRAANFIEL